MPKTCDQKTVGVLIEDVLGRLLMITRGTAPAGIAPVAGHWDLGASADHAALAAPEDVAVAEVAEEVGLTVTSLATTAIRDLWIPTWCRRTLPDGAVGHGHHWTLYTARATGQLTPDDRETRGAAWYTPSAIDALGERTAAYAAGSLPEEQWVAHPGLEPVWCLLLEHMGYLSDVLTPLDLAAIASLARRPGQLLSAPTR